MANLREKHERLGKQCQVDTMIEEGLRVPKEDTDAKLMKRYYMTDKIERIG